MVGFSGILGNGQVEDQKMIRDKIRGKLVKMIKDAGNKFDDYSILLKIRQSLLHGSYELTEKAFFNELIN